MNRLLIAVGIALLALGAVLIFIAWAAPNEFAPYDFVAGVFAILGGMLIVDVQLSNKRQP